MRIHHRAMRANLQISGSAESKWLRQPWASMHESYRIQSSLAPVPRLGSSNSTSYPRARYENAPCGDTDSMLAAAEKMSRAIKDHDEYGWWPRQSGTVQVRQPDSRFCLASQGVRRESKFHLKTSNQPTGASDGAAKREQRCRQLTGLTEPPKSSICMVTMNRPTR